MIERASIREQVHDEVLRMLVEGELEVDENIDERALAEQLGVSRTPIREALLRLAENGLVENRPRRGFHVTPVTVKDAREVYPMIWALEMLAMRSADPARIESALPELDRANDEMLANRSDPRAAHAADRRWHASLVATADSDRLAETLEGLKRLVNRYEHAYMSDPDSVAVSVDHHRAIAASLRAGDMAEAMRMLEENWRHGMSRFLGYLGQHTRAGG